jgi:hypothetical protein
LEVAELQHKDCPQRAAVSAELDESGQSEFVNGSETALLPCRHVRISLIFVLP